jgi:flagellar protein FlaG
MKNHTEVIIMAIEPLGSVMTFQAQAAPQAGQVQKPAVQDTDVSAAEKVSAYDATTLKVADSEKSDAQSQNSGEDSSFAKQQQTNNEQIKKAVENLNKNMSNSEAVFGIHEATNRVTIKIVDKDTKEVIKELPPEKTLDMIAKAWELAGILVDEKR